MASVSLITDIQQYYYVYTGRGEPHKKQLQVTVRNGEFLRFTSPRPNKEYSFRCKRRCRGASLYFSLPLCHVHVQACTTNSVSNVTVSSPAVDVRIWLTDSIQYTDKPMGWLIEEPRFNSRRGHETLFPPDGIWSQPKFSSNRYKMSSWRQSGRSVKVFNRIIQQRGVGVVTRLRAGRFRNLGSIAESGKDTSLKVS